MLGSYIIASKLPIAAQKFPRTTSKLSTVTPKFSTSTSKLPSVTLKLPSVVALLPTVVDVKDNKYGDHGEAMNVRCSKPRAPIPYVNLVAGKD
jgi:hypothetical protein